jgi:hypothetical protein
MRRIYIVSIALMFFLSSCGEAFRVYHDSDNSADFDKYKTYSFLEWTDGNKKTISGMELERIRTSFARELESKGLEFDSEESDLKVQITVYFREARDMSYGYYYPNAYYYMERALAIDVFESETKKHIWHGAAVGEVGKTAEVRAEDLPIQVGKLLASYPTAAKK